MLDRELSVKGWNWGTANFKGASLSFEVGKTDAFEIPLPSVQQCTAGKNEVALEFHAVSQSRISSKATICVTRQNVILIGNSVGLQFIILTCLS